MSQYYEQSTIEISDIFTLLNTIKAVNPAGYRQTYVNTIFQFLYGLSLYLPYFPSGQYTLFESDNLALYIRNGAIVLVWNSVTTLGLQNIAQQLAVFLAYDFGNLLSLFSAVYISLNTIYSQIVPPPQVVQYLNELYADLQKYG